MRIENMKTSGVQKASKEELIDLRSRFLQVWKRLFQGNAVERAAGLTRKEFISKYRILVKELTKRKTPFKADSSLDHYLVDVGFYKMSVPSLREIVIEKDFCSMTGEYVKNPKSAAEILIKMSPPEDIICSDIETSITKVFRRMIKDKDVSFSYSEEGSLDSYIPLYDLILRPKTLTEKKIRKQIGKQCNFCSRDATQGVIYGESSLFIPVCDHHIEKASAEIQEAGDKIVEIENIVEIEKRVLAETKAYDVEYRYYSSFNFLTESQVQEYGKVIENLAEGSSLILNAGSGVFAQMLKNSDRKVFACASSSVSADLIRSRAIEVMQQDFEKEIPFADGSYDNVVALYAIEYIKDTDQIISEIERIAKAAGIVLFSLDIAPVPNRKLRIMQVKDFKDKFPKGWTFKEISEKAILAVKKKTVKKEAIEKKEEAAGDLSCIFCDRDIFTIYYYKKKKEALPVCERHGVKAKDQIINKLKYTVTKTEIFSSRESTRIQKPYPNEHACRKADPKQFSRFTRGSRKASSGKAYHIIFGWKRKEGKETSTEQAYRYPVKNWTESEARKHCKDHKGIKFEPAKKSVNKSIEERIPKEHIRIIKNVKKDERIVAGIVYEPMEKDSQGDFMTEEDIKKAAYYFMEKAKRFKIQHKGITLGKKIAILENYLAPQDLEIGKEKIKKGTWILYTRINDSRLWKRIKDGEVTGYSMAGMAKRTSRRKLK